MSSGNAVENLEMSPVGMGLRKVAQIVNASEFTDGGATTGDYTLKTQIPVGAFVIGSKVIVKNAFDDDTTAVMTIGKTAGQDEFSDGTTIDVATAGTKGDSAEDPMEFIASATDVILRITGASDFTDIAEGDGKMLVEVYYLSTVLELGAGYPIRTQL